MSDHTIDLDAFASDDEYLEVADDRARTIEVGVGLAPSDVPETLDAGTGGSRRGPSKMAAFGRCPTAGRYSYLEGYTLRRDRGPRLMGRLVHLGLAYFHADQLRQHRALQWVTDAAAQVPEWFTRRSLQDALVMEAGEDYSEVVSADANEVIARYVSTPESRQDVNELYVEHEFAARLGDIDPIDPSDPLAIYDDWIVTCRSDRVYTDQYSWGWIEDHKTKARGRNKLGTLPKWHRYNEHVLDWQAMVNLHIVRHCLPQYIIKGFVIHRVQRTFPYQRDHNVLRIGELAYQQAPRVMRHMVALEAQTEREYVEGRQSPRYFWNCFTRFGVCDYAPVCNAKDEHEQQVVLSTSFKRAMTEARRKKAAYEAALGAVKNEIVARDFSARDKDAG